MTQRIDDRIADYLAGKMSPADREGFESEVRADDELADALYAELNLEEALPRAGRWRGSNVAATEKVVPLDSRRPGRNVAWWKIALPAAAAVALFAASFLRPEPPPAPETFRGPESLHALHPAGEGAAIGDFAWSEDPGAAIYEIVVRNEVGDIVWRATSAETTIVAPAGALPDGAWRGTWTVRSKDDAGIVRMSRTAEFSGTTAAPTR